MPQSAIRFGFDQTAYDGFVAVDDVKRIGVYAYWSSDNYESAEKNPEQTAREMLKIQISDYAILSISDEMRENQYLHCCEAIKKTA